VQRSAAALTSAATVLAVWGSTVRLMCNLYLQRKGARSSLNDYGKALFLMVALLPPLLVTVAFWIVPIGDLGADRIAVAARDYTDMWAAGHLVASGEGHILFDQTAFNAALKSMFGAGFTYQVWPYPPPTLLLAVPLSMLPLFPGFLMYTIGTAALLWLALRSSGLKTAACAAVVLSPAVADNALTGQNGSLTGALLLGGLSLVQRRPVLAGVILGALIIKPQLGLLVPVCLVASGSWLALLAMAISGGTLIALSGVLFGLEAWVGFFVHTRPMIEAILQAPWQALPSQQIFASSFMAVRSIGASVQVATYSQFAVTIVCAVVAWRTWRAPQVDPILRAALTGLLAVAAAPWVHSYDMIPLAVAITLLVPLAGWSCQLLLGLAWFWPGAVVILPIPLLLSVASVLCVTWLAWQKVRHSDAGNCTPVRAPVALRQLAG